MMLKSVAEFIRAIVRPFMALSAVLGTVGFLAGNVSIPGEWWGFVGSVTTFYFLQRGQEKRDGNHPPPGDPPSVPL